jgi:hypothetical protein
MALLAHRKHINSRIDFFMNETAERGGLASFSTAGSGEANDQPSQVCTYAAVPSGKIPIGVLMNDVVNYDLTRQHLNWYKDEVQQNSKVTLWEMGEVLTNLIQPGITISAGDRAYLHASGYVSNTGFLGGPRVGTFMSKKDENGYAKLAVNLPSTNQTSV